jgi:hypothetical protein
MISGPSVECCHSPWHAASSPGPAPPEQTHALFGNRAVDSWPGVLAPRNAENAERRLPRMACDRMIAAGITLRVVDPDANPPGSGP